MVYKSSYLLLLFQIHIIILHFNTWNLNNVNGYRNVHKTDIIKKNQTLLCI